MAFPTSGTPVDSGSLAGTSQAITLPTHTTGDRLLVGYTIDGGVSTYDSCTAGWSVLVNQTDTQGAITLMVFEKIAASASETLTITLTATRACAALARNIGGSDTATAGSAQVAESAGVPVADADPPSVTPAWGAADTLWVTFVAFDNGTRTLSSYPANYTNTQADYSFASSGTPRISTAARELNASSENPGTYTYSSADQWVAATIAIKPAAASGASGTISVTTEVVGVSITGEAPVNGTISVTTVETQVSITGSAGSPSDNIRLQPALDLERGAYAASQTVDRWIVFAADWSVENTGTGVTTNATGQPTIDITGSASYVVGDQVPLFLTVYDEGSNPEDRTVRTFFGWVEAVAQV